MGVIQVTVKVNIMFMKNVIKREYVNDKGPQDRTLGNTLKSNMQREPV